MRVRLPQGTTRAPPARKKPAATLRCPSCGSHRLGADLAFLTGARYLCKDCGFRGALVVSRQDDEPALRQPEGAGP